MVALFFSWQRVKVSVRSSDRHAARKLSSTLGGFKSPSPSEKKKSNLFSGLRAPPEETLQIGRGKKKLWKSAL